MRYFIAFILVTAVLVGCNPGGTESAEVENAIETRMARYTPVDINWDQSQLSPGELEVLKKLVEAAKIMDKIFLLQVHPENPEWLESISDPVTRDYFMINFGPWDRLDEDEPFFGETTKPAGAGFYPADMTKAEFEAFIESHPEQKEALMSGFTVIRRQGEALAAVPYSEAFSDHLAEAAGLLREAADLTENSTLASFLNSRADAFLSDNYTQSDKDWMDITDSVIDPTIGPYEVYEDKMMSYKTAFEAFISVVEKEETLKLAKVGDNLKSLEANLPLPKEFASPPRGSESPIRVVNLVFSAGDTKAGVQTIAYNLPNDEEVRKEKGCKKVMMKNILNAKFQGILLPIAEEMIKHKQVGDVTQEAFFNNILFHEMSHGMGPGIITKDGEKTTVSRELKEIYPGLEEAKADAMGVYNIFFLVDKGILPENLKVESPRTYLAGMFRSIRFGVEDAHGKGVALQFNYLMEKGAFEQSSCGNYGVNEKKFYDVLTELLSEILIIQARGDYEAAKALMEKYGHLTPRMEKDLHRLESIPVDIRPVFHLP